jgi:hypothetical protein
MSKSSLSLKDLLKREKDLPAMDMGPIRSVFDEGAMPHIDESQAGRINLHSALRTKYGDGYQSLPAVKKALEHYKKESEFLNLYKRMVGAKHGRKIED